MTGNYCFTDCIIYLQIVVFVCYGWNIQQRTLSSNFKAGKLLLRYNRIPDWRLGSKFNTQTAHETLVSDQFKLKFAACCLRKDSLCQSFYSVNFTSVPCSDAR